LLTAFVSFPNEIGYTTQDIGHGKEVQNSVVESFGYLVWILFMPRLSYCSTMEHCDQAALEMVNIITTKTIRNIFLMAQIKFA